MNILLIEPFYSGSHKHFADQLKKYSQHKIDLLTLEGRFWKWRMYGAAVTLAEQYNHGGYNPDLIMVTDMLDLTTFLSLVRKKLNPAVPVVCYFHENQMAYPWKENSKDLTHERDLHYGMMNYQTCLAADMILFNSAYNMNSLYGELRAFLKKMPDHKHLQTTDVLGAKSKVMPLGLELNAIQMASPTSLASIIDHPGIKTPGPLILWNHRWEHDKNPEDFFDALIELLRRDIPFKLAVVGEQYKQMPKIFKTIPELFPDQLIWYGYASYEDYLTLLNHTDILPVTSNHDFFGISVMEAIHCGARPLLPNRLTYPDLYDIENHPELFYTDKKDLVEKLATLCQTFKPSPRDRYHHLTAKYDWTVMIGVYDKLFESLEM